MHEKNTAYQLPVNSTGFSDRWEITLTGEDCKRLVKKSLIFNNIDACMENEKKTSVELYTEMMGLKCRINEKTNYNIDQINGIPMLNKVPAGEIKLTRTNISVSGWALDETVGNSPDDVILKVNGQYLAAKMQNRPDVAQYFNNEKYVHTGYGVDVPKKYFVLGENDCEMIVVSSDKKSYYKMPFSFTVNAIE